MVFSKWESEEKFKNDLNLVEFDGSNKLEKSGIPLCSSNGKAYLDTRIVNSLVIGGSGSGKTQSIILPMLKSIVLSGESALLSDYNGELYNEYKGVLEENGYKVHCLNYDDTLNSSNWNPFDSIKKLYQEGEYDKVQELIDKMGYYLLFTITTGTDPFWINSAINYFTGLCLYAIRTNDVVNFDTIYELNNYAKNNPKEFLDKIDKNSLESINLSSVLSFPKDTLGSVISVFEMSFNRIYSKKNLVNSLSRSDFNIEDIFDNKTVIFVKTGKNTLSNSLLQLYVEFICLLKNNSLKFNIILDDISTFKPFLEFSNMLNYSRNIGVCFTIFVIGFNVLLNAYGKEQYEIIKMFFTNIIYLLSLDLDTLDQVSNLCGFESKDTLLIGVDELKSLKKFEAIVISVRELPFRGMLVPYYELIK